MGQVFRSKVLNVLSCLEWTSFGKEMEATKVGPSRASVCIPCSIAAVERGRGGREKKTIASPFRVLINRGLQEQKLSCTKNFFPRLKISRARKFSGVHGINCFQNSTASKGTIAILNACSKGKFVQIAFQDRTQGRSKLMRKAQCTISTLMDRGTLRTNDVSSFSR